MPRQQALPGFETPEQHRGPSEAERAAHARTLRKQASRKRKLPRGRREFAPRRTTIQRRIILNPRRANCASASSTRTGSAITRSSTSRKGKTTCAISTPTLCTRRFRSSAKPIPTAWKLGGSRSRTTIDCPRYRSACASWAATDRMGGAAPARPSRGGGTASPRSRTPSFDAREKRSAMTRAATATRG